MFLGYEEARRLRPARLAMLEVSEATAAAIPSQREVSQKLSNGA